MDTPDAELAARAAHGDKEAWGRLYVRHHRAVFGLARRIVDHHEAEDVSHEAFIVARGRLARADVHNFRGWLLKTTKHLAFKRLAKVARAQVRDPAVVRRLFEALDLQGAISGGEYPGSGDPRIWEELGRLPHEQGRVILLHVLADKDYEQIAELLDASVATIRQRHSRAMRKLREAFDGTALSGTRARRNAMVRVPVVSRVILQRRLALVG